MSHRHTDALLAAWNRGDFQDLDAFMDPDFVRISAPSISEPVYGRAAFREAVMAFRAAFPDLTVTMEEAHFHGNRGFARWTLTGTNTGPGSFPPTGKPVRVSGATFLRFRGDLLVEELVYFDALYMMTQLGLAAPLQSA